MENTIISAATSPRLPRRRHRHNELSQMRDLELRDVYRRVALSPEYAGLPAVKLWEIAVSQRAPRFYLSVDNIARIVRLSERGLRRKNTKPSTDSLAATLHRLFRDELTRRPDLTATDFAIDVADREAPAFFVSGAWARKSVGATCRRLGLKL